MEFLMDILLSGSVAYDYLMTFPGLFQEHILPERLGSISLSFLVESMSRQRGGTAPNIASTLAWLGSGLRLTATVGKNLKDTRAGLKNSVLVRRWARLFPGRYRASFLPTTNRWIPRIAFFIPEPWQTRPACRS